MGRLPISNELRFVCDDTIELYFRQNAAVTQVQQDDRGPFKGNCRYPLS